MTIKLKTVILAVSLLCNAAFAAFMTAALKSDNTSVSFKELKGSIAAAMVVNFPAEPGGVMFNPPEINLKRGMSASVQISSVNEKRQADWVIQPLYDHRLVSVTSTPSGIVITALEKGECVVQAFTGKGFMDIAVVRVIE